MKPEIKEIIDSSFPDFTEEYLKNSLTWFYKNLANSSDKKNQQIWENWAEKAAIIAKAYVSSNCQGILEDEEKQDW